MYAIIEVADKQFKVREGQDIFVPYHSDLAPEDSLPIDRVLLVSDDEAVTVGTPTVDGATVEATVLDHVKGDKVLVFKKKRRKRFKVKRGHRQQYTKIHIDSITMGSDATPATEEEPATASA